MGVRVGRGQLGAGARAGAGGQAAGGGPVRARAPPQRARLVNNITHRAYGILGGVQYGIVVGSLRTPRIRFGLPFGAGVWAAGYVVLPATKLYREPEAPSSRS